MPRPPSRGAHASLRIKRMLKGLAFAAVILGGLELVLRSTVKEADLLFAWEHPDGMIKILGDEVYVREEVHHTLNDGPYAWEVHTNALGLRELGPTAASRPAGTRRYLALGDSWMFGTSVTQGQTIPDQLEILLTEKTGTPVEVLNGGIPGGSAFEMLVRWSELSQQLELDGLILGIPHNQHRQNELAEHRDQLYSETRGAPYLNVRTYLLLRHWLAPHTRPMYAEADVELDGLEASTVRDLRTIAAQATAAGMTVMAIEWPHDMRLALNTVSPPSFQWRTALAPQDVRFGGHALNHRTCWGFKDHGHPSEAGARAIAEVIAEVMISQTTPEKLQTQPSCETVPGVGPGKSEWPVE